MKLDKLVARLTKDRSRSLNTRVFLALTTFATLIVSLAFIGDIIYGNNPVDIAVLGVTTILIPVITQIGVRINRVDAVAKILTFGIIFVILPIAFFYGGAVEGSIIPWMIFAYLYVGLVLDGKWRFFGLVSHTVIVILMFVYGYYHPDMYEGVTRQYKYIDTTLSVIEVGYICFVMTWFQNVLFMSENQTAREETRKIEEMNRAQNRFFSNMSHEIRTPINSILGLNEMILRQKDVSEEIKKDATNIQGSGRMLLALINDILDFSKIEAGKMDIVPINYNIANMVSELINMMWLRAEEKGLELNVELDPSVPAELFGDEIRIKQILINLLNNAVKYTNEGSVTLLIEKGEEEGDEVTLMFSVTDTGIGIRQEALPYLFDAFRRLDEDKNVGIEGTGLGLSIVKQLVDLMGGTITVDSVYSQGSTFCVVITQKVASRKTIGPVNVSGFDIASKSEGYTAGFTANDARILIVDDNVMNLEVERRLLEGTGMTIDVAKSGDEALSLTQSERYDLIFMDHLMPEMDGITCMQHIRKQQGGLNNRAPIVVLTANAGSENRELYTRSGFDNFLVKPVTGHQLEEMLIQYLPASKVIRTANSDAGTLRFSAVTDYSRKIPVIVTCASTCDLPAHVLKEQMIDTIPYTLVSDGRKYYDSVEASSDEIVRYMREGKEYECDAPTVDEFVSFFGRELKKAHNLIYVSASSLLSKEYVNAVEAAKSYDNVHVIDSLTNSVAVGLIVLRANRMAGRGERLEKVLEEIQKSKYRVVSTFITESSFFRMRDALPYKIAAAISSTLGIRLVVSSYIGKVGPSGLCIGDFKKYHKRYIELILSKHRTPDQDLCCVVYADLTDEQRNAIEDYLNLRFSFANIVFVKATSALPIFMGPEAFGLTFFERGDYSYSLGSMFTTEDDASGALYEREEELADKKADADDRKQEVENEDVNAIPGIDREVGIKNSGGEETFNTVLEVFYNTIHENHDDICAYYDKEDWKNYTVKVHALKSTALLIGATKLADEARDLELAGKKGDIEFIRSGHDGVMKHLLAFEAPLAKELGKDVPETAQNDQEADVGEDFDRYLIESIYEVLADAIKRKDAEAIKNAFGEAKEYTFTPSDEEVLKKLRTLFESGDYDNMLSLIDGK